MAGDEELVDPTTTGTSAVDEPSDDPTASDDSEAVSLEGLEDDDELPPAPDPDAEPDAPPAPPDGVTVDEKGRWRTADGKFASKQPTKEAEESVKQEVAALAAVPDAPKADPVVPWKPNIYGQEVELIPGAKFHPEHGLLIPPGQIPNATALMARGTKYDDVKNARQQFAQEREQIVGDPPK